MTTQKLDTDRSTVHDIRESRRCSICGKKLAAPQKALSMDGKELCDACYEDCFFADISSNRQLALDRCAI